MPNIRYVITHVNRDGIRTLTFPCQGRYTYETASEAEEWLKATRTNNNVERLWGKDTLEVRPVECWPGHHDPKGIYFDV